MPESASGMPLLALLGGVFTLLALLSPRAALFALIPTVALAPEMQIGGVLLRPDDVMLSVLLISWGLRRLGTKRARTPIDGPLWAYVAVGLAATLWGAAIGTADLSSLHQYSASGLHVVKRLQFVLYFVFLTDTLRSVDDVRKLVYVLMGSLAALSVYSLSGFYQTGWIATAPIGAAIHEPGLAAMLNVALALGLLVAARGTAAAAVSGAVLMGSLWVLPFSLGRNFLVSTLAMLGLVAFSKKRSLLLLLPVGWILAPLVFPEHVLMRMLSLRYAFSPNVVLPEEAGASVYLPSRFNPTVFYGGDVVQTSPFLGWGLGSVPLGSIDSEYGVQFIATGIVGFLVFVMLVLHIRHMVRETSAAAQGTPVMPFVAGLQNGLLGYALYSIFSPSISAARAGAFFFTLLGLVAVLHRELAASRARPAARTAPVAPGPVRARPGPAMGWAR